MTDDIEDIDLPRGVALAWGIAADPQRGPKRELSVERIVDAAVEIADAEGLGAVSMSSVAARLGFTTMSLYRYVSAKDDLVLLMQEAGTGLPPATISEAPDWRTGLTRWSRASLEAHAAHPWLSEIPVEGTPNTPNNLAWMEAALGVLAETPLTAAERLGALLLVTGHTRWEASVMRGYSQTTSSRGVTPAERDRADAHILANLVTAEAFPALREVVDAGVFATQHDPFGFGLALIVDGIQAYIDSGASTGTATPRPGWDEPSSYPRDPVVKDARQKRRDAEQRLREARKREREAITKASEREKR